MLEENNDDLETDNKLYGKYNLTSAYLSSMDYDASSMFSGSYIELKKDGTGVLYITAVGQSESQEFTYVEEKNQILVTAEGETISFNYTSGKISFELEGVSFVFEK